MQYLEKHDVLFYLQDGLRQAKLQQAENTPLFLHEYFERVRKQQHIAGREHSYIFRNRQNKMSFCFQLLGHVRHEKYTLEELQQLVWLICPDMPPKVMIRVHQWIGLSLNKQLDPKIPVSLSEHASVLYGSVIYGDFADYCHQQLIDGNHDFTTFDGDRPPNEWIEQQIVQFPDLCLSLVEFASNLLES